MLEEEIVLFAEISSGLTMPLSLKYSLPSFKINFFCPFTSKFPFGYTLTTVTVILPVKVLDCAAVPAPENDWFAPAVKSALSTPPFPIPNLLSNWLATDLVAAPLENKGGKVTPNVSAFDVVFVVDLLALNDSLSVIVKISPIFLALLSLAKNPELLSL